jgi:hypothetical protein
MSDPDDLRAGLRRVSSSEEWISGLAPYASDENANAAVLEEHRDEREAALSALEADGHSAAAERLRRYSGEKRPAQAMIDALDSGGVQSDEAAAAVLDTLVASSEATAALSSGDEPGGKSGKHLIEGVALPPGVTTTGKHGAKYWDPGELRKAAPSLEGKEVSVLHEGEAVPVGEVTEATFDPQAGLKYRAELNSESVASAMDSGTLGASIEASVPNHDHIERTDEDIPYMTDYEFKRLGCVEDTAADTHAHFAPDRKGGKLPAAFRPLSEVASGLMQKAEAAEAMGWNASASVARTKAAERAGND